MYRAKKKSTMVITRRMRTYAGSLDCLAVCNDNLVWNCGLEYLNFNNIPLYSIIIQSEYFAFGGFHICWSFKSWCKEPLLFINEIFFYSSSMHSNYF